MKKLHDTWTDGMKILLIGISSALLSMAATAESVVTGGKTGTYYAIGSNLRDIVFPSLEVKDSKDLVGQRRRHEPDQGSHSGDRSVGRVFGVYPDARFS